MSKQDFLEIVSKEIDFERLYTPTELVEIMNKYGLRGRLNVYKSLQDGTIETLVIGKGTKIRYKILGTSIIKYIEGLIN